MKQSIQFLIALLVGATYELCVKARDVWKAWRNPSGRHHLAEARLRVCRKCPIFYAPLKTCGTPIPRGRDYTDKAGRPMGCWCYMPVKANAECQCWLYENSNGTVGWPKELNS